MVGHPDPDRVVHAAAATLLALTVAVCAGALPARATQAASAAPGGLPASLKGGEWTRLPTRSRVVALTFDAGSNADGAPAILRALADKGAPASFFLTGRWVERFPATARAIASRYPAGNHTYSHAYLTRLSDAAVRTEVRKGASAIGTATAVDPRPLFRFPYGDRDRRTIGLVNALGYGSIRWSVDTLGWQGAAGGQSVETVVARTLAGLQPGEIVLMHLGSAPDGSTLDADALPTVIDAIRARGYKLTTVYAYAGRYAQVADDGTARFAATKSWRTSSWNRLRHGSGYHFAQRAAVDDPASFRLKVPQAASYRVYAWWPSDATYSAGARFRVETAAGVRRITVDERRRGGRWNLLGTFRFTPGDRRLVLVSRRSSARGVVIADAVRIMHGTAG